MKTIIILNVQYGRERTLSPFYCPRFLTVCYNILKVARNFDKAIMLGDKHRGDVGEFRFLPTHGLSGSKDTYGDSLDLFSRLDTPYKYKCDKNALSAFTKAPSLLANIADASEICLAGFNSSTDILASAYGAIDLGLPIWTKPELIGDISDEHEKVSNTILTTLGVIKA